MTLPAINSLVLFMYCCTAHWVSQAQTRALRGQLEHSLAQPARARRWEWRPWSAPVTWACGILAHSQTCCPHQWHISSQGRLQGAFQRQFRQDAQSFKTDDEHSTGKSHPLCSASSDNSLLACDAGHASLHQAVLRWNISGRMDVVADALSR